MKRQSLPGQRRRYKVQRLGGLINQINEKYGFVSNYSASPVRDLGDLVRRCDDHEISRVAGDGNDKAPSNQRLQPVRRASSPTNAPSDTVVQLVDDHLRCVFDRYYRVVSVLEEGRLQLVAVFKHPTTDEFYAGPTPEPPFVCHRRDVIYTRPSASPEESQMAALVKTC